MSTALYFIGVAATVLFSAYLLTALLRKLAELFESIAAGMADPFGMKARKEKRRRAAEEAQRQQQEQQRQAREAEKQLRQQEYQQAQQQRQQAQGPGGSHKQQQQQAATVKTETKRKSFMEGWREVVDRIEKELDHDLEDVENLLDRQAERYAKLQAKYAKVRYD